MKNLAVIPARCGSKRIPGKNIKNFLGKPIIAYPIQEALKSKLFEHVIVSTDSAEIKRIALEYGAEVPFLRSEKNSDDHATISDVMGEVLNYYTKKNIYFNNICCLFSTAPFVRTSRLREGFEKLYSGDFISVIPIQKYSFPIQRSLKIRDTDYIEMNWPEFSTTRSQDIPDAYHDAGQFYWAKLPEYAKNKMFYSEKTGFIVLGDMEAHDIDTLQDWIIAEQKFEIFKSDD